MISIPKLPHGTILLENQVAGHTFQDSAEAVGMLKSTNEGCVFKPLTKPLCAEREKQFYETVSKVSSVPVILELKPLVPVYHGTVTMKVRDKNIEFLKLTDITFGMAEPCVIDIKIGRRTWDPLATEEKRLVESGKYVRTKENVGFCIPGFQVSSISAGKLKRYGKEYGKGLDEKSVYEAFKIFLNADTRLFRPLIAKILTKLYEVQSWAHEQRQFHIYSSSVLIVYDAKRLKDLLGLKTIPPLNATGTLDPVDSVAIEEMISTEGNGDNLDDWVQVKMIDFAHIFPAKDGEPDLNYIHGINHLVAIFETLLQDASSSQ